MNKLVIILLLALFGCQSSGLNEPVTEKPEFASLVKENTENNLFTVHISTPKQIAANKTFTIDVELKNKSKKTVEIMSGEPVFYYFVRDSSGKVINTITRTDVGIIRPIADNAVISEKHSYQFKKPGIYVISAFAEFTLQDGASSKVYKLETVRKQVEVVE